MTKSILTIISLLALSFCQIQYGGSPKFLDNTALDVNILSPNSSNIIDRNFTPMVFEYGIEYEMDITVLDEATTIYQNDEITYLLKIFSKDAYGIGLNFDRFYLTENSKLFIYDENRTYYFGALTNQNNKRDNIFSTSIIKGETIILELTVPEDEVDDIQLHIDSIIHDSTDILNYYGTHEDSSREDCNINVICSQGDDWREQINGVVRVSMGAGLCSASIINNTANDRTPYVLFADHCVSGSASGYVFDFNGLLSCYIAAIPFFKNTLISTCLFSLSIHFVVNSIPAFYKQIRVN